jgi:hypothetical protein
MDISGISQKHRGTQGEGGREVSSEKLSHKNAIKNEKRTPLDFLTTPSNLLKRIWSKN